MITGAYFDAQSHYHGFVRAANGTITDFDYPSAVGTSATAINTAGTITGFYKDSNGITHSFVRTKKGAFTSFDGSNNPEQTAGWGINTSGVITGLYQDGAAGYTASCAQPMEPSPHLTPRERERSELSCRGDPKWGSTRRGRSWAIISTRAAYFTAICSYRRAGEQRCGRQAEFERMGAARRPRAVSNL